MEKRKLNKYLRKYRVQKKGKPPSKANVSNTFSADFDQCLQSQNLPRIKDIVQAFLIMSTCTVRYRSWKKVYAVGNNDTIN